MGCKAQENKWQLIMKNPAMIWLKTLKRSVQIYWGCTYLCRESSEGTCFEVVSLASSNFL